MLQLGAIFPQAEIGADPSAVRDFAQAADNLGFDYLVAYDHVLGADPTKRELGGRNRPLNPYTHESMFHEVFVLFGHLAALTERIQLMTGALILPQRQTALVAKQAAEIDVLSGGRLILGVGIGWNHVEYEVLGEDYRTRGARLEEQVRLLRELWTQPLVTFEGRFDQVRAAGINPLPGSRIPIWMGGWADPVMERIGRIGDGWLAASRSRDEFSRLLEKIHAAAAAAGRDPSEISVGAGVSMARCCVRNRTRSSRTRGPRGAPRASKSGSRSRSAPESNTAPDNRCDPLSRDFSSTAMARGAPPRDFCSRARWSAADRPAGPPPTISTSTSSVSRSTAPYPSSSASIAGTISNRSPTMP